MDNLTREFLIESREGLDRMERCLGELRAGCESGECVAEVFRAVHTIKGTVGFLGFPRLEKLAHAGEHLLASLRDKKRSIDAEVLDLSVRLMDALHQALDFIESTGTDGTGDDDLQLIALLLEYAGAGGKSIAVEEKTAAAQMIVSDPRDAIGAAGPNAVESTLRVDVETLNRLMNLVGELVQTRNQFLHAEVSEESFHRLGERLDSVTADLRESVMEARMQPVGQLFQKFPRLVREVAHTCGKQVVLETSGGETGLDKSLLEALKDPLTHAVRNAIDHGIEMPIERALSGKAVQGRVALRAYHEGGQVVIEVSDDGSGVCVERVLQRAVERGLVTAEEAAAMDGAEAMQLLFAPGFSTSDAVTMISGRGVGMDVVRSNVEQAGGSVELQSVEGKGTTLRMRVPLTLAIVPALVAQCGGEMFAVPHSSLLEMVGIDAGQESTVIQRIGNAKMFQLRDALLPLLDLSELLGVKSNHDKGFYVAVLAAKGRQFGLIVDDMAEPQEIVVKPLSRVLSTLSMYSGATLLGDGRIALILDTNGLARGAKLSDSGQQIVEAGLAKEKAPDAVSSQPSAGTLPMIVFADHDGEQAVVLLDCVERIEKVDREEIELLGGRPVMQYRGELLSLEDHGALQRQEGSASPKRQLVLICRQQGGLGTRVGLLVRSVLDVVEGEVVRHSMSHESTVARVKGRLAMFSPGFAPKTEIHAVTQGSREAA